MESLNRSARSLMALAISALLSCAGCYDGERLLQQARAKTMRTGLEELDLGTYRTTLPRDPATAVVTEIEFQIFGNLPRYRIPEVETQLESDGYRLRYAILTAVRQATAADLADPDLVAIRKRLADVANELLAEAPIHSIGFEALRFVQR